MKIVFLILIYFGATESAKILGIFPLPAPSHFILGNALMRGLAQKGHDVTIISAFSDKNPPLNGTYRNVMLTDLALKTKNNGKDLDMFDMEKTNVFLTLPFMVQLVSHLSEQVLNHTDVQKLIHSGETFDVVIIQQPFNDALKAFAAHFKASLILFSTVGSNFWVNNLVGNPAPPSYVPDLFLSFSSKMTFCERFTNGVVYLYNSLLYNLIVVNIRNSQIKKYFPHPEDIKDVDLEASLLLLNSHPSINNPVPYVPSMIEIGGFHVKPPKKLPRDLQEFLDGAENGVIYFSMGSNLKSANLPIEKRIALLKTFAKLKQRVLWKWEDDILPGQPKNVKLGKWLPQQDILAHPNVRLFITHGGLLSTTETIYHGVPILAIPVMGDQKMNAQMAVNNGFGLTLGFRDISETTLGEKLDELLNNPKYRENAKLRSKLFHDRPVSPMDTATYWVEYVVRHKGAGHLRVAALDLPWYQYHLLDVILVVLLPIGAVSYVLGLLVRKIVIQFRNCKNEKKTQKTKKKN